MEGIESNNNNCSNTNSERVSDVGSRGSDVGGRVNEVDGRREATKHLIGSRIILVILECDMWRHKQGKEKYFKKQISQCGKGCPREFK